MAFSFSGEFAVRASPEETYDFLTDPKRFCPLLPDYEKVEVSDPQNFTVAVKVGISHIRGTATVKLRLADSNRPSHALFAGKASMAGGNVDLNARFDLRPVENSTVVAWKGEAQVFGRLTSIAGGLLAPLAQKNVQKVIAGLQQAMNREESLTTESPRSAEGTSQRAGTDIFGVPR